MVNQDRNVSQYDIDTHLDLILKVHNTLNMIKERTVQRKREYKLTAVRTIEVEDVHEETQLRKVRVVKQMYYPEHLYQQVLEEQQIDSLQRILKEEKDIFFSEQIRILKDRAKEKAIVKSRVSQSKSSDNIQQPTRFFVQGTPLTPRPTTAETAKAEVKPLRKDSYPSLHSKSSFRTKYGVQCSNAQRELVIKPEKDFLKGMQQAGATKAGGGNPKWQYVREKEINKWEILGNQSKTGTCGAEACTEVVDGAKEKSGDTNERKMYTGDSEENTSANVMKYFYAPFHWIRKSF